MHSRSWALGRGAPGTDTDSQAFLHSFGDGHRSEMWASASSRRNSPRSAGRVRSLSSLFLFFLDQGPGLIVRKPLWHKAPRVTKHFLPILWDCGHAGHWGRHTTGAPEAEPLRHNFF